ncbi:MAG: RDD family protein [Chloroflexota bacterium]|jgi:uncharacterized RDD family membrane protein YckC
MQNDLRKGGLKGQYAGFVSRLLAYAIDIAIITVMLIAFGWLIDTVSRLFPTLVLDPGDALGLVLAGVVVVVTAGIYYIFFWTLLGQTPGKMLLGVRIVSLDGSQLTLWQSLRRYVGYYLSALALYAGYWWVLIDNRRQGWHDKLAGTIVVYAWDARLGNLLADRLQGPQNAPEESD